MEDISNRTLALFLVAAIVVSIGGTLMVLNSAGPAGFRATGFATNTTYGEVNLSVQQVVSIAVVDGGINFGNCEVTGSTGYINSSANTSEVNIECDGAATWNEDTNTIADIIKVENDGNIDANVTVKTNTSSADFFIGDADDSFYRFYTANYSTIYAGGCAGDMTSAQDFTAADTEYNACSNLTRSTTAGEYPGFRLYVDANLTSSVTGTVDAATLTFTAREA